MAGEGTKKEREIQQDPNQNPERNQQPGKLDDPSWKRNKPDQYNEDQGGGLPPVEQAGNRGTQTGHENPKSGSGQQGGQNQPQGGQQGQEGQRNNPEQQGGKRPGQNEGPDGGKDRGESHQDSAQKRDVQDRDRNKNASETDERGAKQGQKH